MLMRLAVLGLLVASCLAGFGCKKEGSDAGDPSRKVQITVLEEGTGPEVEKGDLVMIEYVGRLPGSETPFDSNDAVDVDGVKTKPPLTTVAGSRAMIAGFDDSLIGMKKGEVRKLLVPWELGYGAQGNSQAGIPGKADLEFVIEVLDFVKPGEASMYDMKDTVAGTGRAVKKGDTVTVHYKGTYANGGVFDNSRKRGDAEKGGTPLTFKVGERLVISGVDDGILGMKVGGTRVLTLPPSLVYGQAGANSIQGNQVVTIELELLSIE